MIWDDAKHVAFDFETSGELPEYALQPWRLQQRKFWTTSISVIQHTGDRLAPWMSTLFPNVDAMRDFLAAAIDNQWTVVTWNGLFDVSILIAHGLRDLVFQVKWLDAMLLWKHLEIDPEYDVDKPKKKSYRLKPDGVARFIPQFADTTGAGGQLLEFVFQNIGCSNNCALSVEQNTLPFGHRILVGFSYFESRLLIESSFFEAQ